MAEVYPQEIDGQPVLWSPLPGFQHRFCASGAFEALGGGAAGPGKTSCLIALAAGAAQHPNGRVLFCRTVYKDLLDVRDRMMRLYPLLGATWEASDSRWRFPSGGTVLLAHGATMTELNPFLGPEYTAVMFDELSLVKEEQVWQMLLSRIRSTDPTVRLMARATANPVGPGKPWISERFISKCGGEEGGSILDTDTGRTRAYVPGTSKDNTYLPSSYWDGLRDLPESLQVALRDGKWFSALGLFYPELSDDPERLFITQAQCQPFLDWHHSWGAFDWGFGHPAVYQWFTRVGDAVYWRDTLYMHRYQDEEQAAYIKGNADPRSFRTVYAGHDAFAKRMAHSAAAETVADVFLRYSINLERASIDRAAGSKVVRRFIAPPKPGPMPRGTISLRIVDTPGNRRAVKELAALIPSETDANVPAKRDADEKGQHGDDGADTCRYGLATPSFELMAPPPVFVHSNIDTGVDKAPWEQPTFALTGNGQVDRREYVLTGTGPQRGGFNSNGASSDPDLGQFPE